MDKSWMQLGKGSPLYMRDIFDFLEFVRLHSPPDKVIHIRLCNKCLNRKPVTYEDMYSHLALNGICLSHTTWTWYGENQVQMPTLVKIQAQHNQQAGSSNASYGDLVVMNILNDVFPFAASRYQENVVYDNSPDTFPNVSHVNYSSDYDKYNMLLRQVQTPLYPGSEHTVLGTIMKQMKIKNKQGKTNVCFDEDIALMKEVLRKGNSCPENFDQVKNMLLTSVLITRRYMLASITASYITKKTKVECPHCYEVRYKASTSSKQKNPPIPTKVLRYFPLGPRLQRLYMSSYTAKHMRWHQARHQGEERIDPDNLTHPADGEAWKHFDRSFLEFAGDCRNVRLILATDGFNPTGNMNLSYSIWPVIVFPYNLPPNMCTRKEYNFLTLMVPGPYSPGKCLECT